MPLCTLGECAAIARALGIRFLDVSYFYRSALNRGRVLEDPERYGDEVVRSIGSTPASFYHLFGQSVQDRNLADPSSTQRNLADFDKALRFCRAAGIPSIMILPGVVNLGQSRRQAPKKKLVVLDGYALNPGDLSWTKLESLATCEIFDRTPSDLILDRAAGAEILLTNKTPLRKATLEALPDLRYIGVLSTGHDVVDVAQAAQQNVVVTNVPSYGTDSVAQAVFALLLELTNNVGLHSDLVRQGEWSRSPDFCFWQKPLIEINGKTMGIVGYGRIGRRVAAIASAFGMPVIVTGNRQPAELPPGIHWGSLDDVFSTADVISLHCPLRESTRHMVNATRLARMKPSAFLINTSRGGLIAEEDLASALNSGRLAGAGLDVLSTEPPEPSNPLLSAENCIVTPHIAWATREARSRLLDVAVENLRAWLNGSPQNVVN
jgi:glycerate dehydrogenase